ncbi:DUF1697 domain-containing protein [Klenkia brasiliensis]|uniref:Uncharacterized conserved protein, DUF1697 family n=1 Tax=Klenkia brasiliensis TaxID=333142 RepID=A0A1G7SFI1_9ACTN|nr:DUF1697 domain-containing protein [Klenkia brasiliensis]SDG21815.1 Uncharacterized conserved protein, DUF1697 family [Klenkia brasiliensis]
MRHVAFVRNLNQGQRGHATTADLLAAFADAGCRHPHAFRSNGTVVLEGDPRSALDAMDLLAARTGVAREVFVLPLDQVAAVVAEHGDAPDAARREFTLHAPVTIDLDERTRQQAARRRCRILQTGHGWAVTVNERDRESHATPVVERLTGAPASSRGLPTLVGLVDRFG